MSMMIKNSMISKNRTVSIQNKNTQSTALDTSMNTLAYRVDVNIQNRLEKLLKNPNFSKNIEKGINNIDISKITLDNIPENNISYTMHAIMESGDAIAGRSFYDGRTLDPIKLKPEAEKTLAKYYNAAANIQKGGKEVFKEYNLEYAAIAAFSNNKVSDERAQATINAGNYSDEAYQKIKNMADELQNKAGVFVTIDSKNTSVDFSQADVENYYQNLTEHTDFTLRATNFSYNNTLVTLGGKDLTFMSDHKEAESIWINLVQGDYNSDDEVINALQENGYSQVAEDFKTQLCINGTISSYYKDNGELWDVTVGYQPGEGGTIYPQIRKTLFGSDDISFKYSKGDLNNAYKNAATEYENLQKYPMDRDFSTITVNSNDNKTDDKKSDPSSNQISALRKRLSALTKQLHELKSNGLNRAAKAEIINTLEKSIQTIQQQIDNILENKMKNTLQ